MDLDSRWLTNDQFQKKSSKYQGIIFCDFTPPAPEDNLKCSAPAISGTRCLSCRRIEIFYSRYENNLRVYFPTLDETFQVIQQREFKSKKISREIYAELKRLDVKVCPFSYIGSELVCGVPLKENQSHCKKCTELAFC